MRGFKNVLFVVEEGAEVSEADISRVVALVEANQADLALLFIAARPRLGPFARTLELADYETRVHRRSIDRLEQLLKPHADRVRATYDVRLGTGFIEVVQDVLRNGRDLVVKPVGYGGSHTFLFGGTDQHLLRKCPCPVWIMQREERSRYERIMAAVDFDPWEQVDEEAGLNRRILEAAAYLAIAEMAELHIVHAWEPVSENIIRVFGSELSEKDAAANIDREQHDHRERLEGLDRSLRQWLGKEAYEFLSPRLHLRKGNPRQLIPELAIDLKVDLVVMGTLSRTGVAGLIIGNTAEVILNNIECAVLAVKPEGFVSPVRPAP